MDRKAILSLAKHHYSQILSNTSLLLEYMRLVGVYDIVTAIEMLDYVINELDEELRK